MRPVLAPTPQARPAADPTPWLEPALEPWLPPGEPWRLRLASAALGGLFGLLSGLTRRRATHARGVAATGHAEVLDSPGLPAHDFFQPGRVFPAVVRHGNLSFADGRRRDIRSATLRLGGLGDRGWFDMPMNTGATSAFWDLESFVAFLRLNARGPDGLRAYEERFPLARPAALDALTRGPSCYSHLDYYGQLTYRWCRPDGLALYVRYRLVPDGPVPANLRTDEDPWLNQADPQDDRSPDYLCQSFGEALLQAPVHYRLQLQVHEPGPATTDRVFHSGLAWEAVSHPWHDLLRITLDSVLSPDQTEGLRFNVGRQPRSLGLVPAPSASHPNALALVRTRVYATSQRVRGWLRRGQDPDWDHRLGTVLPRVAKPGGSPPQGYTLGRFRTMCGAVSVRIFANYVKHRKLHALGLLTPQKVQADYPRNLTQSCEADEPGSSRTDAVFVDLVVNGFYPVPWFRDPARPERIFARFCWDHARFEGPLALANSTLWARLDEGGLRLEGIDLQLRDTTVQAAEVVLEPVRHVSPTDDGWDLARLLVNNSVTLEGQALAHFVACHLNMEQYAVAVQKRLRHSPLRALLVPHLKEVQAINEQGDGNIFGETGVLCVNSALSADSATRLFVTHLGRASWTDRPRPPLWSGDRAGRAAAIVWEVIAGHVHEVLEQEWDAIALHWNEVFALSQDLVFHSVPWTAPRREPDGVPLHSQPAGPERVRIGGVVRALPPVTRRTRDPEPEDFEALASLCTYVIFQATFAHTWANDRMHDGIGDLDTGGAGLPDRRVREALARPDRPFDRRPPPWQAAYQLFFANYLSRVRHGFVLRDESGDMPRGLKERLAARREALAELGFDVETLRSNINI